MFATRAELKSAVTDETLHTDAAFMAAFSLFVRQCEARVANGGAEPLASEPLRCDAMELAADITMVDGSADLPADWLGFKRVAWNGSPRSVPTYLGPAAFHEYISGNPAAPMFYTIEARKLLMFPRVSGPLSVTYYRRFAPLVADTDTNALLTAAGEVYLSGVLFYAYKWLRHDEKAGAAFAEFTSTVRGLNLSGSHAAASGNHLAPTLRGIV